MKIVYSLFTISIIAGFGATVNVAKPSKGSTVAVFGLGAVGLSVSLMLRSFRILLFRFMKNINQRKFRGKQKVMPSNIFLRAFF